MRARARDNSYIRSRMTQDCSSAKGVEEPSRGERKRTTVTRSELEWRKGGGRRTGSTLYLVKVGASATMEPEASLKDDQGREGSLSRFILLASFLGFFSFLVPLTSDYEWSSAVETIE